MKTIIGRSYPKGNIKGEAGKSITIDMDPTTTYFSNGVLQTYNTVTGKEKPLNVTSV